MESLYLLIPLSLIVLLIAVAIFVWAVNSGQYDDVDREGERILFDDDNPVEKPKPPATDERNGSDESAEEKSRND